MYLLQVKFKFRFFQPTVIFRVIIRVKVMIGVMYFFKNIVHQRFLCGKVDK